MVLRRWAVGVADYVRVGDAMNIETRWLTKRDLPEVLAIESASFAAPWDEDRFVYHLRQRYTIGMVAEVDHEIVGYQVYSFQPQCLELINIAVASQCMGCGIGTALIERLIGKLSPIRSRIVADVCERNLGGQLFFKYLGFRAVRVLRDHFSDGQDAYQMVYRIGAAKAAQGISVKEAGR